MFRILPLIFLIVAPSVAVAVELFGVNLNQTSREELRAAVQQSGAELISEGNDAVFFDAYDSTTLIPGSRRLYLGFVRSSGAFSFAEYEFPGLSSQRVLAFMQSKYGAPDESRKGDFISDQAYVWNRDGISIELSSDWSNYRVLLSYRNINNLQQLLNERSESLNNNGISLY